VKATLAGTDIAIGDSSRIRLEGEWNDHVKLVDVLYQPDAYGYPTYGYGGSTEVLVNRMTGKFVSVTSKKGRTCDPPVLNLTEGQAIDIASRAWRGSSEVKKRAALQYFIANGSDATERGKHYAEQKRARLCWCVIFRLETMSKEGRELVKPLSSCMIDAETGEILAGPE